MKLSQALAGVSGVHASGQLAVEISSVTHDSRKAAADCLFIALAGAKSDGNRFVRDAVAKGAGAVLSELNPPPAPFTLSRRDRPDAPVVWIKAEDALAAMSRVCANFYGHPSSAMAVVGVTGTNGKTTTTYFLESIFAAAGGAPGVLGTVNYRFRGKELEPAPNTTPLSDDLQRLLAKMKASGATHVAMEVSSHALSLKRVDDVDFDVGIFTNLHRDHLDYHKTREAYLEAKARLFDLLSSLGESKKKRAAVINADDPAYSKIRRRVVDRDVVSFGLSDGADLRGLAPATSLDGTVFRMKWKGRERSVRLQLIGAYNVHNALGAAAAALWLGVPEAKVIEGLEALEKVPGRLEPVKGGQPFHVFVDYAHTDSALQNVLDCLAAVPHKRLITVVGCGGDRDATKRGPMGAAACAKSDAVILTSDNPRSEDPMQILFQIEAGVQHAGLQNYKIIQDRKEAIYHAVREARPGDIVLIAGKGHENYQILKDRTIHFDDRETAREAVRSLASTA
ncbi:MAG: UDP-N-acetylmuramoyl-L-alanyl-D-glutamate--2,6-diaminopimelate ligase [Elusimicrobia bacterium]|nr:UDP-N-acetylmuramoyl-L-alanyl-D-glutamate--2,6-diaminopimelate ligase [Elusimicrobiota bacterium]